MSEQVSNERPTQFDDAVLREAAEKLYPSVAEWLGQQGDFDEAAEREEIIGQLAEALDSIDRDGYALAKSLEHDGWMPDSDLVDTLESASHAIYAATERRVREWVAANDVRPSLAVGTPVAWKDPFREEERGAIVAIRAETAEYVVQKVGKSYSPPSPIKRPDGSTEMFHCGVILAYERVKAAESSSPAGAAP